MSLLRSYSKFSQLTYQGARCFANKKSTGDNSHATTSTVSGFGNTSKGPGVTSNTPNFDDIYNKANDSQNEQGSTHKNFSAGFQGGSTGSYSGNETSGKKNNQNSQAEHSGSSPKAATSTVSGFGNTSKGPGVTSNTPNFDDIYNKANGSLNEQGNTQKAFSSGYQGGSTGSYSGNENSFKRDNSQYSSGSNYQGENSERYSNYSKSNNIGRGDTSFGKSSSEYQFSAPTSGIPQFRDPVSSVMEFAGAMAENAKNFATVAGEMARDCVEKMVPGGDFNNNNNRRNNYNDYDNRRGGGYNNNYRNDSYRNDYNRGNESPSDYINTAARNISSGIDSAAQGLANAASSFIPGGQAPSGNSGYNSNRRQDRYNYNDSIYRGPDNIPPPQFSTSSNPQFNSFSSSGPTSGFGRDQPQDFSNNTKNFVDGAAQNVKNFADQAAYTAKEFVDRGLSNTTANMANSTIRGFADSAYTVASNFIPNNQQQGMRDNTFRYNNNNRRDGFQYNRRDDYNRRDNNTIEGAVQAAFQNASSMARGAFSVASFISSSLMPPGQMPPAGRRETQYENRAPYTPRQNYRDQYVSNSTQNQPFARGVQHIISTNPQFNAFSTAGAVSGFGQMRPSTDFASTAQHVVEDAVDGLNNMANQARNGLNNFANQNAPYNGRNDYYRGQRNNAGSEDMVSGAVNAAGNAVKGIAEGVFSIASSFMPGSQPTNQRPDPRGGFQGGSYNNRL